MVRPGRFTGELLPGGVGEIVCLRDAHFLLLGAPQKGMNVGGGGGGERGVFGGRGGGK